jgi:hypothetical protein
VSSNEKTISDLREVYDDDEYPKRLFEPDPFLGIGKKRKRRNKLDDFVEALLEVDENPEIELRLETEENRARKDVKDPDVPPYADHGKIPAVQIQGTPKFVYDRDFDVKRFMDNREQVEIEYVFSETFESDWIREGARDSLERPSADDTEILNGVNWSVEYLQETYGLNPL